MQLSKIIKIAKKFEAKLAQEATPTINYDQNAYRTMARELDAVIENYIKRNPIPVTSTKKPSIQEKTEDQEGRIAMGVIITKENLDKYLQELNNEISKLDSQYEGVRLYAFYDSNDPRKARV